jgi:peptidyl-prolyl cis-trans isomerase SurA
MIKNILVLLTLMLSITTVSAADKLNKIVAVVNGDVITQHEINTRMSTNHQTSKQALDDLINNVLEIKLAQNNNIQISDSEINSIITNIAKSNNLDIAKLAQELKNTQGLTMQQYKEQIHDQVLVNRLEQQMFAKDIHISDQEIAKVMTKPVVVTQKAAIPLYQLADILIEIGENAPKAELATAQDLAIKVLNQVKNSNDIKNTIAKFKNSVQYNDLGMRKLSELPDLFVSYVKKMQVGQTVGPIHASNGFHILKLLQALGLEQKINLTKDQARELVFRNKLKEHAQGLIKELRESAYIRIMN